MKTNSPAGYWRLGETSGATKALDSSGNAAEGNYGGTVTLGQAGALVGDSDTAATFDGSSGYAEVPDASALDPASAFTLEAWVKIAAAPSATEMVVTKPFTVGDKQSYSLGINSSGKAVATVVTTSNTYSATSSTVVTDGNWHLLDATFASSSLKIYVDAGTAVSTTTAGTLQYSTLPLEIGRFDSTAGNYFGGSLDEVAVYGAALSAAQITADKTAALTPETQSGCGNVAARGTSTTYALGDSDIGKQVYVQVTGTDSNGSTPANSLSGVVLPGSAPQPTAPVNSTPPDISGTPAVGQTLEASNGVWSGTAPITYTYQWQSCLSGTCTNISGATSQSYTVQSADQGTQLAVSVTATNSSGSASVGSAMTAVVVQSGGGAPVNTVAPSISGLAEANQTLTASGGSWTGATPISLAYQWQLSTDNGTTWNAISGATSSTYVIPSGDVNDLIRVAVTATNGVGNATAYSAPTGQIASGTGPTNTAPPTISGNFSVGETLTASAGTWSGSAPLSYSYQWQDCGSYNSTIAADGPAGYWRLDEPTGSTVAADSSGHGLAGTYVNSFTFGQPGALVNDPDTSVYSNDGKVTVPDAGGLDPSGGLTVEAWADPGTAGSTILEKANVPGSSDSYALKLTSAGDAQAVIYVGSTTYTATSTSAAIGLHYLAATYDGANLKLYVDGVLQATTAASGSITYSTQPLTLGHFFGTLDEVAVYPAALNGTQISAHYHAATDVSGAAPCANISGANDASYTLTSGDVGHKILVQVTASNPDGTSAPVSSASHYVGGSLPVNVSVPSISGTAAVGNTLTANPGTWSGAAPISYAYQWQSCEAYAAAVMADSPVAYWRLNELSGTTANDSSGSALNGTYSAVTLGAVGDPTRCDASNTAGGFNGSSSYVSVASNSKLILGSSFSVEAWFQGIGSNATVLNEIVERGGSTYANYAMLVDTNGHASFRANTTSGAVLFNVTGSTVVTGGGWYHLVGTWNGSTASVYVNGVLDASAAASGSAYTTAGALDIGRFTGAADYAKGTIDDVAVYGSALSAAQVAAHYQAGNGMYTNIAGATNQSYAPATGDAGNRVRVQVTASNGAGSATAISGSSLVTSNGPTNDVIPSITGSAQVGETLSASPGVWSGAGSISYGYQWQSAPSYEQAILTDSPLDYWRLDEPAGSTTAIDLGSSHVNGSYCCGSGLQLAQPGALNGDPDTSVLFQPGEGYVPIATYPVDQAPFTLEGWFNTTANSGTQVNPIVSYTMYNNCLGGGGGDCAYPQIMVSTASGKLQAHACDTADSCITITTTSLENDGKWHQFQLERSGSAWALYLDDTKVGTATGAGTYLTDSAANIELGAAYSDDIGYSGMLDEVALYNTLLSCGTSSTCSSGSQIDNHFKAATTPPTFTAISGATSSTYAVQAGDVGKNLRVEVTASNASGSTPADSNATGSVTGSGGPVNTALPKISGSLAVGQTLVSDAGSWTGQTPINYSYQWQRITASYANAVLADGPTAHWRLDEPAGTTLNDASGNGHTGSYSGNVDLGASSALTGDPDTSLNLPDTNGYATAPNAASLDTPSFTIEGWVRALTTASYQKIMGKGPDTSEQWGLYIAPTTGYANVQAEIGSAQVSLMGAGSPTDRVGDNTWHYVAATWDATATPPTLTLYWSDPSKGQTLQTTSVTEAGKTLKTNTEQISIGKEVSSTTNQYPLNAGLHQLDELAVYSKALSAAQLQAHYNAGRTAPSITPITGATASSYTLATADEGASVRTQVTASNANGSTIAYSLQTVPLGTNPPTLDLPKDGAASHTPDPVLSVQPVTGQGSVSYKFQVAADKGFTSIVADSGWLPSTTTWTVPTTATLADGHTYFWHAAALYGGVPTSWSSARSFRVLVKRLGVRSYWPIWSGDGVSVNETNGNLILGAPAPSVSTEIGSIGVTLAYNAQDSTNNGLGAGWTLSGGAAPPSRLIDHAVLGEFDAAEIVWPSGGSDYYDHVGSSNTYRAPPGSGDQLTKNKDGTYTLLSADGFVYSFGVANGTTGVAQLTSAEAESAGVGKSVVTYTYNAGGKLTGIYDSADSGRTVTLNWSCTGYLVCITGPDGVQWTYKGVSGGTGALATVNDGTRNLVTFTYGTSGNGNGLITKIQNANDLDPTHTSLGSHYNTTHAVTISYDADKRVTSVVNGPIYTGNPSGPAITATWQFTYHLAGPYPTDATRADHADGAAGTVRQAAGYTTITDPNGHQSETYYDSADHPMETVDPLGRITEAGWNAYNEEIWSEDGAGNPTDSTWDTVNNVLRQTQLPDSGNGRPTTTYRYDEKAVGTAGTQGSSLQGVRGQYFPNVNLAGRATTDRNDANVDFDWGSSGPDAGVGVANFSARFTGDLIAPSDGDYVFSTYSDSGTILVIDSLQVINAWTTNTKLGTQTSQPIHLSAGAHLIDLDYFEGAAAASHLHLLWSCATCSSPFTTQIVPASALAPAYENQTSVVDPTGRIAFTHYSNPAKAHPDYTLAQPGDGSQLITSFTYNSYGQVIQKVMPKGNLGRSIGSDGALSGGIDTTYATNYAYYAPGDTATPPSSCVGGSSADQGGQLKSESPHGIATTSYVYDAAGDTVAKTDGRGTTCFTLDRERRLSSEIAPGDAKQTTFTYDPAGNQLTESDGSGTLTSVYDEANRVLTSTDSYGAQAQFSYDAGGNLLSRTAATGSLAAPSTSPHYVTSYAYDSANELTSETDPAGLQYQFFYDSRGNLHATQYPNGTFSWSDFNPDGWLSDLYNRHGTLSAPLPFSAPADASPVADYSYQYNQAGQKTQETLSASGQADQVSQYSYDGLGRLSQALLPSGTCRNYGYDADSNRMQIQESTSGCGGPFTTTATYTYDPSGTPGIDQLTSVTTSGTTTYSYTADGQVKSYGSNTVSWDGWQRISGGTFGGTTVTYKYDPAGALKLRTSSNGAHTRYLLGDLIETDGSGTITTAYVDGPAGDLAQYGGAPAVGAAPTYLYYNGHGDLAAEADGTGTRSALHTYDPFGGPTDTQPVDQTAHRYTGRWAKQYDTASALILMGARPYDPSLGRFLAVDPIQGGSLNDYEYAGQDPINGYDLTGLSMVCDADACRLYSDGEDQITTQQSTSGGVDSWTVTDYSSHGVSNTDASSGIHIAVTKRYFMNTRTSTPNQPVGGLPAPNASIKVTKPQQSGSTYLTFTKIACGGTGYVLTPFKHLLSNLLSDIILAGYCAPPAG